MILCAGSVGLALVPTTKYWLLLLLRCLSGFGSASVIALGAGIVADIALPHERGGFIGLGAIGPAVGPFFSDRVESC